MHNERASSTRTSHRRSNSTAFALIEVIVVISIVALLMAIALPALQRVGNRARGIACQGRLRHWGLAFSVWQHEHDGQSSATSGNWDGFQRCLQDGQRRGLLLCPMASRHDPRAAALKHSGDFGWGSTFTAWSWPVQEPPTGRPGPPLLGSYGLNSLGLAFFDARLCRGRRKGLAATPILLDSVLLTIAAVHAGDEPPAYDGAVSVRSEMTKCCIDRHGGGINSLFLDWSTRKTGLKELWTLKWSPWFDTQGSWTKAGGVRPQDWPEWMHGLTEY